MLIIKKRAKIISLDLEDGKGEKLSLQAYISCGISQVVVNLKRN